MKPILIIFTLFILNSQFSILNSTLWEIKQDGTGDFTSITAGINAAVDGDTLLVHRGIYYENIHYGDKNIVITSLYGIESNDRSIIRETVIDGNQNGTVVMFNSRQITRDAILSGFTIRNGAAWRSIQNGPSSPSGGIFVGAAAPIIRYCIVEHNFSYLSAGGIFSYNAGPLLIGNIIRYNHGHQTGGVGISGNESQAVFCSEALNSIYLNYGGTSCDLNLVRSNQQSIVIDTMTVQNIDPYFVAIRRTNVPQNFSLTINHGKIEPVEADLYVSPDGCDSNSGLTPEEPLQRIATAMMRIQPDEQQQRTVHVAEGIYSHSLNNQLFPIGMRNNIDITGEDKDITILDGEDKYLLIFAMINPDNLHNVLANFSVNNVTIARGHRERSSWYGALHCWSVRDFTLKNIDFINTGLAEDHGWGGFWLITFEKCDNFTLKNIGIYNNNITHANFGEALFTAHRMESGETFYAENVRIRDNYSPNGPSRMHVKGTGRHPQSYHATFVNLEMTDNTCYTIGQWGYGAFLHIDAKVRIINATIAGNRYYNVRNPAAIVMGNYRSPELSVYNSIFYDNGGDYQIFFNRHPNHGGGPDVINVSHSLIENGREGITEIYDVGSIVNWGEGNIDEDPLFVGHYDESGNVRPNPYMLTEDSPARGAGTLEIPNFEFPEVDLAGNPRIVDGRIDMGAYQWHPPEGRERVRRGDPSRERQAAEDFGLRNFPNPVTYLHSERQAGQTRSSTGTNISFTLPDNGKVTVEIYNLKGQFVKRLFDAYIPKGEHNIFWDGRDERGRYVATGFYMYNLLFNEQVVATGRATFIK